MAPHGKHPDERENPTEEDQAAQRALNNPVNAVKAVAAARACIRFLTAGQVWTKTTPHGEVEIKGSLMLEEEAVLALHFSPEDGSILPKGLHGLSQGKPEVTGVVEALLPEITKEIEAMDGAEYREPESCWAVPVVYRNKIVGHLKVTADGSSVMPDKKAAQE